MSTTDASRVPGASQLPQKVQDLVSQLFDVSQAEATMSTLSYELDTRKMPLGKISAATIRSGYAILKEIEDLLGMVDGTSTDEIKVKDEPTGTSRRKEAEEQDQDSDATEEEDEGVAASAAKEAPGMDDDHSVFWYWKGDSNESAAQDVWIRYNASTCVALEEARAAKEKKYKLDDERFIDFGKMVQARYDDPKRRRALKRETPAIRRAASKRKATMAAKKAAAAKDSKAEPAGNIKQWASRRGSGSTAAASNVDDAQSGHGASAAAAAHEPLNLSNLPTKVRQGLLEASTRFYSKIPHAFGNKTPPVLLSKEQLKDKSMLLDELLQLERTAQIIRSATCDDPSSTAETKVPRSPIDVCYGKLNCDLNVLKPDCAEYQLIEEMLKNTHGDTHRNFSLSESIPIRISFAASFVCSCCAAYSSMLATIPTRQALILSLLWIGMARASDTAHVASR